MRRLPLVLAAVAGFAISAMALAAIKPGTAVAYRQGVYRAILWNFVPMNDMVRGRAPWNQVEFAKRAARVSFYSQQLLEGFPPGSRTGRSEAKPGIWTHWPDFEAKMQAFENASATMAQTARGTDEAATKAAFAKTAETCKSCHDKYRRND
ncbi:MAG TPA: cytochrome c [Rhodanobacteraceae bacterium]|nr:cytochrome c [Rhodanobacteraceae bacterium]